MSSANSLKSNVPFPSISAYFIIFFNLAASHSIPRDLTAEDNSLASIDPLPSESNLLNTTFSINEENSSISNDPFPSISASFIIFLSSFASVLIPIYSIAALSSLASIDPLPSLSNFLKTDSHLDDPLVDPPKTFAIRSENSFKSNVPFPSISAYFKSFFNLPESHYIPKDIKADYNSLASIEPLLSESNLLKIIYSTNFPNSSTFNVPLPSRSASFKTFYNSFWFILIPNDSTAALSSLSSIDPLPSLSNFLKTFSHFVYPEEALESPLIIYAISSENSLKSKVPFPSISASFNNFFNLPESHYIPKDLITINNSLESIEPLLSESN
jgi:hypothetical protein